MKKIRVPIFTEEYAINLYIGTKGEVLKEAESRSTTSRLAQSRGVCFYNTLEGDDPIHPLILLNGDLPWDVALSTVAHEASHAMDYISEFIGMNDKSGEFKAHGISAVMRAVAQLVKRKKR